MGYRTDIRLPTVQAFGTVTATSVATLSIPARTGFHICLTGVSIIWETAATSPITPTLRTAGLPGTTLGFVTPSTAGQSAQWFFTYPFRGVDDQNVVVRCSTSAAAQTINISALVYFEPNGL